MDVFFDEEDRYFFLKQLAHYTTKAGVSVVSYCLMTNHTHLLLVPSDEEGLASALKPLHMRYSQYLNHRFSRTGLNWQGRFFSAPLDTRYATHAFRYVAENPVRAGMVARPEEDVWSSARSHMGLGRDSYVSAPEKWLQRAANALIPSKGKTLSPEQCEELRRNKIMNLPIGTGAFISGLERMTGRSLSVRRRGRPAKAGRSDKG